MVLISDTSRVLGWITWRQMTHTYLIRLRRSKKGISWECLTVFHGRRESEVQFGCTRGHARHGKFFRSKWGSFSLHLFLTLRLYGFSSPSLCTSPAIFPFSIHITASNISSIKAQRQTEIPNTWEGQLDCPTSYPLTEVREVKSKCAFSQPVWVYSLEKEHYHFFFF